MSDLDIEEFADLRNYLLANGRVLPKEELSCEKLAGGVSNRTVLVKRETGGAMVLKQALKKLRVNVNWFSEPERIHVEAQALRQLPRLAPSKSIPAFLFEDFANHILAMEAVPTPHREWKSLLLQGVIVPAHFEQFGTLIGTIHCNSCRDTQELRRIFDDRSFFESLRLEPYYLYAAEQAPEAAAFLFRLADETRQRRAAVVHGDYSPKNILIHQERLVLLDFEVVHFGDPAFDLGFSLTHFLSKGNRDAGRRQEFLSAAKLYWESYWREIQDTPIAVDLEPRAVRHTLGCLLARVIGRSPLEYLNLEQQRRQKDVACRLMQKPPSTVSDLISDFGAELEKNASYRSRSRT